MEGSLICAAQLSEAVKDALQAGDVAPPSELMTLIATLEKPIRALQDFDRANELFEAFVRDFAFIRRTRFTSTPMEAPDLVRYASLFRWVIRELRCWRPGEDPRQATLVAILVAVQACDFENNLWQQLPDDIGGNAELGEYCKRLVGSFTAEFGSRGGGPVPIRESEILEGFIEADKSGDWVGIIDGWQRFPPTFANALQAQPVRFLYRYDLDRLVEGLANLRQICVTMQVAQVLTAEQRLRVAILTDNPYVQLASAYRTLAPDRHPIQELSDAEQQLLYDLLLKVAHEGARWHAWMRIFNTYPVRYPTLQTPLGRALAGVQDSAIATYVGSIHLFPKKPGPDPGRQCVAACLRVFRANASAERRNLLWTLAHERWLAWRFDAANPSQHVFEIMWSELDYAVVAHACEVMDESERQNARERISAELSGLDDHWHPSFSDIISSWNRLLSQFQPYAHASLVAGTEDWLSGNRTYWPFDQTQNKYLMMKYNVT